MQESDFRRLHWPILDFFRNRGISPEFSQDLVQETFLQAFKSRENFRGESKLDTWVGSIARNEGDAAFHDGPCASSVFAVRLHTG